MLVKLETLLKVSPILGGRGHLDGLLLPFDRALEVAGLGEGRRKSVEKRGLLAVGQLTGFGRRFDRLQPMAIRGIRAGGEQPGARIVRVR